MLEIDADLAKERPCLLLIIDNGFAGKKFEHYGPNTPSLCSARPARRRCCGRASRC